MTFLAAPDFFVWIIIIAIWALSSYFDHKRKKKQAEERKRAAERARQTAPNDAMGAPQQTQPSSVESRTPEYVRSPDRPHEVREEVERQKSPEEILREILLGQTSARDKDEDLEYDDELSYDERPSRSESAEIFQEHFQEPREAEDRWNEHRVQPFERVKAVPESLPSSEPRRMSASAARALFASREDLRNAVIASEILGKPKARRRS